MSDPARSGWTRRAALASLASLAAAPGLAQARPSVVVVGGGFGGATAARFCARLGMDVTLVVDEPVYAACPMSSAVIVGMRDMREQLFGYDRIRAEGVKLVVGIAEAVDGARKTVTMADGSRLAFDRAVVSPGVALNYGGVDGYSEAAAESMPHAWRAGAQTDLLRRQIDAMEDGGTVVMSAPATPYRCPPGPYERASLIAWRLAATKPRSKLILLDSKDQFSKQGLFQAAWRSLFKDRIEWVPLSQGGKLVAVEPETKTFVTDFGRYKADVANVIPPQRAAGIAQRSGLADRSGWCPVDPVTFESRLQPHVHVIGDAAVMGAMPKSAFSANGQGKVVAHALNAMLRGGAPDEPILANTCYSLVQPDYAISIAGVYRPQKGVLAEVAGSGGVSVANASPDIRKREADHAFDWFKAITHETFG